MAPDFFITRGPLAAADFSGANSGVNVFTAPAPCQFLDVTEIHTTAGTNSVRVKKIAAGEVDVPGAAADADNVTISDDIDLTVAAQTPMIYDAITDDAVNFLDTGDRVALASAAGTASLVGAIFTLRFAWL